MRDDLLHCYCAEASEYRLAARERDSVGPDWQQLVGCAPVSLLQGMNSIFDLTILALMKWLVSGVCGTQLEQASRQSLRVAQERRKPRHHLHAFPVPIVKHDGTTCGFVHGDAANV